MFVYGCVHFARRTLFILCVDAHSLILVISVTLSLAQLCAWCSVCRGIGCTQAGGPLGYVALPCFLQHVFTGSTTPETTCFVYVDSYCFLAIAFVDCVDAQVVRVTDDTLRTRLIEFGNTASAALTVEEFESLELVRF